MQGVGGLALAKTSQGPRATSPPPPEPPAPAPARPPEALVPPTVEPPFADGRAPPELPPAEFERPPMDVTPPVVARSPPLLEVPPSADTLPPEAESPPMLEAPPLPGTPPDEDAPPDELPPLGEPPSAPPLPPPAPPDSSCFCAEQPSAANVSGTATSMRRPAVVARRQPRPRREGLAFWVHTEGRPTAIFLYCSEGGSVVTKSAFRRPMLLLMNTALLRDNKSRPGWQPLISAWCTRAPVVGA